MKRSIFLSPLVIGAAALGVAACGSSSSTPASSSNTSSGTPIVSVAKVGGSDVLANSAGKTLYSAAVEKGGMIRCTGGCTSFWKPLTATSAQAKAASAKTGKSLGVVKRPDGTEQLTFDGMPLYSFATEGAGKLQGNGFSDVFAGTHFKWQAAQTGGGAPTPAPSKPSGSGYGY
jgi:predicted lipoprotein with Yx(FWY)xxD motif